LVRAGHKWNETLKNAGIHRKTTVAKPILHHMVSKLASSRSADKPRTGTETPAGLGRLG
jgi:hypothetical protein